NGTRRAFRTQLPAAASLRIRRPGGADSADDAPTAVVSCASLAKGEPGARRMASWRRVRTGDGLDFEAAVRVSAARAGAGEADFAPDRPIGEPQGPVA